jgi:hypothetical protein
MTRACGQMATACHMGGRKDPKMLRMLMAEGERRGFKEFNTPELSSLVMAVGKCWRRADHSELVGRRLKLLEAVAADVGRREREGKLDVKEAVRHLFCLHALNLLF